MDLISRQAAIDVADSSDCIELSIDDVKKVTDEVVKGLKRLPSAQPVDKDIDVPSTDTISRQAALEPYQTLDDSDTICIWLLRKNIEQMPSAQQEPAIPLSWIENYIAWLKSLDNPFSKLTAMQISTMVKKWKDKQDE